MEKSIKVAPSLLSADCGNYALELERLHTWQADYVHIDVMDGMFVPRISFGLDFIHDIRRYSTLPFDVHLMIEQPERYIPGFVEAGADVVTFHAEATKHMHLLIQLIHNCGAKAGIAINPGTPVSAIEDVLADVDLVLVMSVNPGVPGQSFIRAVLRKVHQLTEIRKKECLSFAIEMDGGIDCCNLASIKNSRCDIVVIGRSLFSAELPERIIRIAHQGE